jgi:hypothetical protein
MIGETIFHYLEKLGEGGLALRSFKINLETPNDW